jgi:phospholipase/carboxylesterase
VSADGQDLIGLAQAFGQALPHARFAAPDAPEPSNMAPMGRQWFSLQDRTPARLIVGIEANMPLLNAYIDDELAKGGLADHQLALIGFSQGTMMSLYTAPRRARRMAAVLGYSGAQIGGDRLAAETKSRPPVFLIHGDADNVVPVPLLHAGVAELQAAEFQVQWCVRPGLGHGIDPEGVRYGAEFLVNAFRDSGAIGSEA